MPIMKFGEPESPEQEQAKRPNEELAGTHRQLWERAKAMLGRFNVSFEGKEGLEQEADAVEKIRAIENGAEGEENMFLDLQLRQGGQDLQLRTIGQIDPEHNPEREINYDDWDLTAQEEAERWLNREILIGEKLNKFLAGEPIMADELISASRGQDGDMFLLKRTAESNKEPDQFGEMEGRALAKALLNLQHNLKATELVREVMLENNLKTKLEMEQKIFEDYFDDFDGYMDNSADILGDLDDEVLADRIKAKMEKYRGIVESRQLGADEFSLAHGKCRLESMVYANKKILLSNWMRPGTTQNRELSLVYDLGDAFNDAVERLEAPDQAKNFIAGIESEIRKYYDDPEVAEAIIDLTKLRSFAMIVNDMNGTKKEFVKKELDSLLE